MILSRQYLWKLIDMVSNRPEQVVQMTVCFKSMINGVEELDIIVLKIVDVQQNHQPFSIKTTVALIVEGGKMPCTILLRYIDHADRKNLLSTETGIRLVNFKMNIGYP